MPLRYEAAPAAEFRQGEILADIVEHRADLPAAEVTADTVPVVHGFKHALAVIMTADCDLAQDFAARQAGQDAKPAQLVDHILLCDLFLEEELRSRMSMRPGREEWRQIRQWQNERYHSFDASRIGEPSGGELPPLYIDFKRHFTISTHHLYAATQAGGVRRVALIPLGNIHNLMHRFYGFLSRVGVEE